MNRIAKIAALLIALTAVFSFSQESTSVPTEKSITCDQIHNVNLDSITLKTLKDVEAFYSSSFKDIHSSYMLFLAFVAILCAIFGTVIGIFANISKKDIKENLKEAKDDLKENLKEVKDDLKENLKEVKKDLDEYKEMKKEFEKIKNEFEHEKKLLDENRQNLNENCKEIYGEIEYTYFSLAIFGSGMGNNKEHFIMLAEHFATFRKRKIKPEYIDLQRLTYFDDFIKKYDGNNIEVAKIFFCELDKFIKYGDAMFTNPNHVESKFLEDIKEIQQKLYNKFGGENKVLEAIKNFKSHL